VTVAQRIKFYRQIATLIRAGVPIRASLERLRKRGLGSEVAGVFKRIDKGERLGEAFAASGFSDFESHLVGAGEHSGQLDAIFDHLSEFWAREREMYWAMVAPMIYPIVLVHLSLIVWAILDFNTLGQTVATIHFIERMAFFYAACFVIYVLVKASWPSPVMRTFWLNVPIIGGALKAAYAYRWITALRLEFGAGISLYRAVGDAWLASDFVGCKNRAKEGSEKMLAGAHLSELVKKWRQLPREWVDYIETGELSGDLVGTFNTLQAEAATRWRRAVDRMTEWIPKIAYAAVLVIVGFIVYKLYYQAVVAPIYSAIDAINNAEK
jgi:type IV pilus assembly protein PilC